MTRTFKLSRDSGPKSYRVNYAGELNSEQHDVVMAPGGPMLVIAGAGSGKTRTLTYRVARLIEDGIPPNRILLLTFTNKAAREMLMRVEALCGMECPRGWSGTFHHMGNLFLRRHAESLGLKPNFSIMDREDTKDLLDAIVEDIGYSNLPVRFVSTDVLVELYSLSVNTEVDVEGLVHDRYPQFTAQLTEIQKVLITYNERKLAENLVDFDDLQSLMLRGLLEHEEIRTHYQNHFLHILVDEYQDTNKIQADLVDLLVGPQRNLMVVGDDAQSIYSFRGANFENIITFPDRFRDAKIFYLTTNYRSTPEVLNFANDSIRHNQRQFEKELHPVRESSGVPVTIVPCPDVYIQAEFCAQKILQLMEEGLDPQSIAILYRSHFQSMEVQLEFTRRGIPYEIRSGMRFFEQKHVKDIMAFLRITVNASDEPAWKRALKLYPTVGNRTAALLHAHVSKASDPLRAAISSDFIKAAPKRSQASAARFQELVKDLMGPRHQGDPAEAIRTIVEVMYRDYAVHTFPNAQARLDDLEEMAQFASRYGTIEDFLRELALLSELSGEDVAAGDKEGDRIILSTVHQAKGLEWDAVIVIGLAEHQFPSHWALKSPDGEEEERRLFYVACTRARDELVLAYPQMGHQRGNRDTIQRVSRFIGEVSPRLWEPVQLVQDYGW